MLLDRFRVFIHKHHRVWTQQDDVSRAEDLTIYPNVIHERADRGIEVVEHEAAILAHDPGMIARNTGMIDHAIIFHFPADRCLLGVQAEDTQINDQAGIYYIC